MNYTDYLQHHGVLGMKWGVRKYQNKDGSLTAAGKNRYAKDSLSKNEDKERESPDNRRNRDKTPYENKEDQLNNRRNKIEVGKKFFF